MSNRTIRIKTDPEEFKTKLLKVNLEQDFDFLEILSLSISQEEVYRRFCSDYGVVVGRAIMNNGVGIPNAKVSIFVPLSEEDSENDEISGLYPFETITDNDDEGKRYNLLPNSSQFECHTPVGTLATKREILDNDLALDIHCKYYKYTAITNSAGDFMIFGVPVGSHFINVDCDLSDIGIYSQRPYDFIATGQPKEAFESSNKFKGGEDLDKLNQIKSQQSSINVSPFWGDEDQCSVGITRFDVDLKHELKPSAIFMGSIFGDNEKNSINKICKPRKNLGKICETMSGPGSIDMLRKDLNGNNQTFVIEGGRVIDDDGTWAFLVPMNLDYMVTNEYGDLVPTDDPTKGIPTRSSVRFRAGMDISGGEGRLRTRALHLIPHNPDNYDESDYSFGESTGSGLNGHKHFHDMYWNKIYTVKQFIPRFQARKGVDVRAMIGIKDVDDCTGTHNPFPFNRMDSDINPLFSILCIIITIISFLVVLINSVIITLINVVIFILNGVLKAICKAIFFVGKITCALKHPGSQEKRINCRKNSCIGECNDETTCKKCCNDEDFISYIPCITMECQNEQYAPGCISGTKPLPWHVTEQPFYYPDDDTGIHGFTETVPPGDGGWAACVSLSLAESLNVWEFDFYNDWINGTLYSPLLKYKKKRKGKEKFCEYDCKDFGGGVDGDDDGNGDNRCHNNWLVDSCTNNGVKSSEEVQIRDGLVKSYDDDLYYAVFTHEYGYKLFSTDIVTLGSVFDCDWQGKPKIQQYLVPTSYKTPELLPEFDDLNPSLMLTSGYDSSKTGKEYSLFFDVSCLGLTTGAMNCINIKRQCEIGVGLNEDRQDESPAIGCSPVGSGGGATGIGPNYLNPIIDNCDIDFLYIRDAFIDMNDSNAGITYNSTSASQHATFGSGNNNQQKTDTAYEKYRNIQYNKTIEQPWGGSMYFYFGLQPGKTALDKMNSKFFETCVVNEVNDFLIVCDNIIDVSTYNGSDGEINISIIGGTAPYTYLWSNGDTTQDISGVPSGTYNVTVTDNEGLQATQSCTVSQPFSVNCLATPVPVTLNGASDGAINVVGIGGGTGPYTVTVTGTNPPQSPITHTNISGPTDIFSGLIAGEYSVVTTDSTLQSSSCSTTGVTITTPPSISVSVETTNVSCYGESDGNIELTYISGVPPISFSTTSTNSPIPITTSNINGLSTGTYTSVVTDSIGQSTTTINTITSPSKITGTLSHTNITCNGSGNGTVLLSSVGGGTPPYTYSWDGPTTNIITDTTPYINNIGSGDFSAGTYTLTVTDNNYCSNTFEANVLEPEPLSIEITNSGNATCNGTPDGFITFKVSGGNPDIGNGGYQVRLNGGVWFTTLTGVFTFSGNYANTYTIQARDVNNCMSPIVTHVITEPPAVSVNQSSITSNSIVVNGSGGNGGPYTFKLNVGSWQSSGVFTNLTPNTLYAFRAKDAQGCISPVEILSTTA